MSYLASASNVAIAVEDILTRAQYTSVNVTASLATTSTTRSWLVNFRTFADPLPLIVVDTSKLLNSGSNNPDHPVLSSVVQTQELTYPIRGSFTLSFNGSMTIDLPYDVSS